jgi:hypothetical protein
LPIARTVECRFALGVARNAAGIRAAISATTIMWRIPAFTCVRAPLAQRRLIGTPRKIPRLFFLETMPLRSGGRTESRTCNDCERSTMQSFAPSASFVLPTLLMPKISLHWQKKILRGSVLYTQFAGRGTNSQPRTIACLLVSSYGARADCCLNFRFQNCVLSDSKRSIRMRFFVREPPLRPSRGVKCY